MQRWAIILLLGVLVLAGCLGETPPPVENATANGSTPLPPPPVPPTFLVLTPEDNQAFETDNSVADVDVSISTSNLIIRPPSGPNRVGEGHFIFRLDDEEEVRVFSKQYTLRNIEPGEHLLTVRLVHNDGSDYSPMLEQSMRFVVRALQSEPAEHTVTIRDFSYEPVTITISAGDRVTWINEGNFPRTATQTGVFNSGTLARGQRFTHTFTQPGTYEYTSVNYPGMHGTVIVQE